MTVMPGMIYWKDGAEASSCSWNHSPSLEVKRDGAAGEVRAGAGSGARKDVQAAVLDGGFRGGDGVRGALGNDALIERREVHGAVGQALAPILCNLLAAQHASDGVGVV